MACSWSISYNEYSNLGALGGVRWVDISLNISVESGSNFAQKTISYSTKIHKVIPISLYNDSVFYNPPIISSHISYENNAVISVKTIENVTETSNYIIWCLIALDE